MSHGTADLYKPVLRLPRALRPWALGLLVWLIPMMTTALIASVGVPAASEGAITTVAQPATDGQLHMTGAQCASCHQVDAGFTHPVDKIPSMQVPAGLPLEGGRVTCITCHDSSMAAHNAANGTVTGSLLRMPSEGGILCTACHTGVGGTRQAMHPLGTERAHLSWPKQTAAAADEDGTRSCLSCHDGTVASDAFNNPARGAMGMAASGAGHPAGVPYSNARPVGKRADGYLQPVASLDPRVRLFNGQVGCMSCHSVYSSETMLLVKSNRDSALCITCHDMR